MTSLNKQMVNLAQDFMDRLREDQDRDRAAQPEPSRKRCADPADWPERIRVARREFAGAFGYPDKDNPIYRLGRLARSKLVREIRAAMTGEGPQAVVDAAFRLYAAEVTVSYLRRELYWCAIGELLEEEG